MKYYFIYGKYRTVKNDIETNEEECYGRFSSIESALKTIRELKEDERCDYIEKYVIRVY